MSRVLPVHALVTVLALHAGGCSFLDKGKDKGSGSKGDCVAYRPAEISGTKAGAFTSASDVVKIPLPETDIGGGLLKVTYVASAGPLVGSLWLGEGEKKDVPRHETSAFGPGVSDVSTAVVTYRLAGKKRYELGVKPFYFNNGGKNGYSVTYAYEAQVDCYEANDTSAAAKRIQVNQMITASLHTGIGTDDLGSVNATGEDWYTFELSAPKTVHLRATLPGKDGADGKNSAMFTIFTADGATAAACSSSGNMETDPVAPKEAVETCKGSLAAGKYFVKLAHFASQFAATAVNVAPDKSWNTPYTFTIHAD